jgi:hypothetical protein
MQNMSPLPGGFMNVVGRYRQAPTARISWAYVAPTIKDAYVNARKYEEPTLAERIGKRLRVNSAWRPDPDGEFETVNELQRGCETLENKTANVQYLDTFLFEADEVNKAVYKNEEMRVKAAKSGMADAEKLFVERLRTQKHEAERLFKDGKVCRVVYSGSKSYHMLVRIKDSPTTLEEYKWLHAHLCTVLSNVLMFDQSTSDPARLTRAPITVTRTSEYNGVIVTGVQSLLCEDWSHVYDYDWRLLYQQWLDRPLNAYESIKGKRMIPSKPEYMQAMKALMEGTFFTDAMWNGRRQQCFFPAYRLCRLLGFSHDELWADGGILDGLDGYVKQKEIGYWRERETCALVKQIDADIDEREKEDTVE